MDLQKFSYDSMGTTWEISLALGNSFGAPKEFPRAIADETLSLSNNFDKTYSRFKKDSLVWKIADGGAGTYEVPEDFLNMLQLYFDLYEKSEKKLNPLIGFALSDLGYDHEYSLTEKEEVRKVPDLMETVRVEGNKIIVMEPVLFDFGALGKGYFVDKIASFLKEKGFTKFLVNGSGDIYYFGSEPASFGLEDPEDSTKLIGTVTMNTGALCASGTNRRRWNGKDRELHHELDATTLVPADFISATWVQAPTCALADALATCLFFCPPENFSDYKLEYLLMNKNREIKKSPGLIIELY